MGDMSVQCVAISVCLIPAFKEQGRARFEGVIVLR